VGLNSSFCAVSSTFGDGGGGQIDLTLCFFIFSSEFVSRITPESNSAKAMELSMNT